MCWNSLNVLKLENTEFKFNERVKKKNVHFRLIPRNDEILNGKVGWNAHAFTWVAEIN